eukprot:GEMP01019477.1.p1 GENE.GEMP01019477.1~~GEMP01019477.1.p1  ORF type:complete len:555 (+),score=84.06 GEMP01019477.1:262-1926(+)
MAIFVVASMLLSGCVATTPGSTFVGKPESDDSPPVLSWRRNLHLHHDHEAEDDWASEWHYFSDCYKGQNPNIPFIIRMGVLVDRGFFVKAGNERRKVEEFIEKIVEVANTIFMNQLSVKLRVERLITVESISDNDERRVPGINNATFSWLKLAPGDSDPQYTCAGGEKDHRDAGCTCSNIDNVANCVGARPFCYVNNTSTCNDMEDAAQYPNQMLSYQACSVHNAKRELILDHFKDWVVQYFKNTYGLWHLFTDCFIEEPTEYSWSDGSVHFSNTGGIAAIRAVCKVGRNAGVTAFSHGFDDLTTTDIGFTFAHEVGHNLGAEHTFHSVHGMEKNTHKGLMDYDDDRSNEDLLSQLDLKHFQLNPVHKPNICDTLSFFRTMFGAPARKWGNSPSFSNTRECFALEGCPRACDGRRQCTGECNIDACGEERTDCNNPCSPGCLGTWIGDGHCDAECFNANCNWDGWNATSGTGGDCDCYERKYIGGLQFFNLECGSLARKDCANDYTAKKCTKSCILANLIDSTPDATWFNWRPLLQTQLHNECRKRFCQPYTTV